MNSSWRLAWIFITTLLASTLFEANYCQMEECGFQGIDLQQCLEQGTQMAAPESCCKSLNQAIQVGYYCICKLIGSTTPLLTNSLVLPMPNCFISIPPLNQCQEPPPVSPQMPPEWQMQPSTPKVNDSSLDSTLSNGSSVIVTSQQALVPNLGDLENGIVPTSCGGNKKGIWLLMTGILLLAAVLLHVFLA